ncbi:MAG: twin-arginine translocase subunit TatC [Chloroflexi bacterium]|nr:twin-arginine translocase subunit TatC [Chloroflexota bacterium]
MKQNKDKVLTLKGHLEEIRRRLIRSLIVIAITTTLSLIFARHIFDFFVSRKPEDVPLVYTRVIEMVTTYFKVCLYAGVVLALPFLLYELVMFIHPALTRNERRYLYLLMPTVILCFLAGAAFGYYVFLPPALGFLLHFPWYEGPSPFISIGDYISVITKFLFAMGLIFELPVLMFFLTKIGVVSPQWLSRQRKFAIVAAFILAGFLTPTVDPINQTVVAIPIILLYEVGILLSRLARKERPAARTGQG